MGRTENLLGKLNLIDRLPGWSREKIQRVADANGVKLEVACNWVLSDPDNYWRLKGQTTQGNESCPDGSTATNTCPTMTSLSLSTCPESQTLCGWGT